MKQLKNDLKALSQSLNELRRKTEQMAKKLDKLEKPKPVKRAKAKTAARVRAARKGTTRKAAKATAIGTILDIITRAEKGVGTATLKKRTGFESKKIFNVINSLKAKGKIKSLEKGLYVRVS